MSAPNNDPSFIGAIYTAGGLLFGAVLTFLATRFWFAKAASVRLTEAEAKEKAALTARVAELETQLRLLSQTVIPISTAFQAILVKELTHFHTPIMDALMVKLGPPFVLSDTEERELIVALAERSKSVCDLMTESERDAAAMLPMVIKRVKAEAALDIGALQLAVVALSPSIGGVSSLEDVKVLKGEAP